MMVSAAQGRWRHVIAAALAAGALTFACSADVSAVESGSCRGASAPLRTVQVHVVGRQAQRDVGVKVVAELASDELGRVSGELVVGRGRQRLEVLAWCRLWSGGRGADEVEGVLHVLGVAADRLVRLDVKAPEDDQEGSWKVRVRTRASHHEGTSEVIAETRESNDGEEVGWTSLTGEGWLAANRVRISVGR